MELVLIRMKDNGIQTLGELFFNDEHLCYTLELPWKNNERQISCIPTGTYKVKKRHSQRMKEHFHVLDVDNRSYILIHKGNYYTDIRGCVLVGSEIKDINGDGFRDVTHSTETMEKLLGRFSDFSLTIINNNI